MLRFFVFGEKQNLNFINQGPYILTKGEKKPFLKAKRETEGICWLKKNWNLENEIMAYRTFRLI